ncbi:MAG: carbohydrate kinase family protein [bacterium]
MFDIITIGDSVFDIFYVINEAEVSCDIDRKNCKLCVDYGEKIPVQSIVKTAGGNSANVAVAAAHLGYKTAIYTHVGGDAEGEQTIKNLRDRKVATSYVVKNDKKITSTSAVITFEKERTIFSYHEKWDYKLPKLPPSKFLYLTSCGNNFASLYKEAREYAKKTGAKIIFAPGSRQVRTNLKNLQPTIKAAELFILNLEEANRIAVKKMTAKEYLKFYSKVGAKNIIITNGTKGSHGFDGTKFYFVRSLKVKTREKAGAGDSYAAAVIAAQIDGKDLEAAMKWGAQLSAAVVQKVGAQKGLITKTELLKRAK